LCVRFRKSRRSRHGIEFFTKQGQRVFPQRIRPGEIHVQQQAIHIQDGNFDFLSIDATRAHGHGGNRPSIAHGWRIRNDFAGSVHPNVIVCHDLDRMLTTRRPRNDHAGQDGPHIASDRCTTWNPGIASIPQNRCSSYPSIGCLIQIKRANRAFATFHQTRMAGSAQMPLFIIASLGGMVKLDNLIDIRKKGRPRWPHLSGNLERLLRKDDENPGHGHPRGRHFVGLAVLVWYCALSPALAFADAFIEGSANANFLLACHLAAGASGCVSGYCGVSRRELWLPGP
jgi:hypothetical protein